MGTSTDAILFYGYNLGSSEDEWHIEEAGEDGEWEPDWYDAKDGDDDDIVTAAENRLLASVGFTESDWRVDGYYERKGHAEARVGVELDSHCSGDFPIYFLAAHKIVARRGYAEEIDLTQLEASRVEQDWDGKLRAAVEALGITPKQAGPKWLLVSYWG
jgi:hypothetical protein